tara:strand:- start:2049 stop:2189 length:141 start_codon:yes stop_codon:yes gene_type:complete
MNLGDNPSKRFNRLLVSSAEAIKKFRNKAGVAEAGKCTWLMTKRTL